MTSYCLNLRWPSVLTYIRVIWPQSVNNTDYSSWRQTVTKRSLGESYKVTPNPYACYYPLNKLNNSMPNVSRICNLNLAISTIVLLWNVCAERYIFYHTKPVCLSNKPVHLINSWYDQRRSDKHDPVYRCLGSFHATRLLEIITFAPFYSKHKTICKTLKTTAPPLTTDRRGFFLNMSLWIISVGNFMGCGSFV